MKNKYAFLLAISIVAFVGCRERNSPETQALNYQYGKNPEFVTETVKGNLYRIWVDMGQNQSHDRIYFFENDTNTITLNSTIRHSKSSHVQATMVIDGVEYIRK